MVYHSLMVSIGISKRVRVLDSHTEGEPTRVVIEGGPELGNGPLSQRLEIFRSQFDSLRSALTCEPRGSEIVVGALLWDFWACAAMA